jgi:glycosyltransferase involved in cell wall biosynthesis
MKTLMLFLSYLLFFTAAQSEISQKEKDPFQKTIAIFTYQVFGQPAWDSDSIKSGIVGGEEAVIYISQELAQLGYKVLVFRTPPENSPHASPEANPRYVNFDFDDGTKFDIAISWRMPTAAAQYKQRAQKVYLWPHDIAWGYQTEEQISEFDDVLWLSEWHRQNGIAHNQAYAKFTKIFGNGIKPEQFQPIQERENPYSCIYGSNYSRGLEVLLDIWPQVRKEYPKATLDIYYGWEHWGTLSPEKEKKLRCQLVHLASLDVREHGKVGHEELNRAYGKSSLWTYPCTTDETFCITALRAQASGAIPVIIERSALPETVRSGYKCATKEQYLTILLQAMKGADKVTLEERKEASKFVFNEYTWKAIALIWKECFESHESRLADTPQMNYR